MQILQLHQQGISSLGQSAAACSEPLLAAALSAVAAGAEGSDLDTCLDALKSEHLTQTAHRADFILAAVRSGANNEAASDFAQRWNLGE